MKKLLFFFISAIVFYACSEDIIEPEVVITPVNTMNFDDLEEGQTFRFALIIGDALGPEPVEEFYYTGDTLEIEVMEVVGNTFMISESITDNSPINNIETDYYPKQPNTYVSEWLIRNDSLIIGESSTSFRSHLMEEDILNLERIISPRTTIDDWTAFIRDPSMRGNSSVLTLELNGNRFLNLNVMFEDLTETDGPGIVNVYSRDDGIVRTFTFNPDFPNGFGWDRIE